MQLRPPRRTETSQSKMVEQEAPSAAQPGQPWGLPPASLLQVGRRRWTSGLPSLLCLWEAQDRGRNLEGKEPRLRVGLAAVALGAAISRRAASQGWRPPRDVLSCRGGQRRGSRSSPDPHQCWERNPGPSTAERHPAPRGLQNSQSRFHPVSMIRGNHMAEPAVPAAGSQGLLQSRQPIIGNSSTIDHPRLSTFWSLLST